MMGAGFQGDIGGRTARQRAGLVQSHTFGMGASARLGPAASDDAARLHDDAAHRRIGPDIPQTPPRQAQGMSHVAQVVPVGHVQSVPGTGRSSDTNLSKSSASWKFL